MANQVLEVLTRVNICTREAQVESWLYATAVARRLDLISIVGDKQ